MNQPRIVTRDEWIAARKDLLLKEKALTRAHDALAAERRRLPMVRVDTEYVFDTPSGPRTLADLFEGRSQLVVYHFMFGPDWKEGCPSCSLLADHIDGSVAHLAQRDVSVLVVSRAPLSTIAPFKQRMGWRFRWASSYGSSFNRDYGVTFTKEEAAAGCTEYNFGTGGFPTDEAPGVSVFFKSASGQVYHTYSTYARGGEPFIGAYHFLDVVPKGRDEGAFVFPMAWVRHHDRYVEGEPVDRMRAHEAPIERQAACCDAHATQG